MSDRDQEFVEVSIEEFASGKPVPFAIFIRLTSWKYLQITNAGESLDGQRLEVYKDKNVRCLYLRKEDFSRYVGIQGANPTPVAPLSGVAAQQLAGLRASATTTLELLRGKGINDFLFENSKEFVESTLLVLSDDRAALAMLAALTTQESSNYIYEHSLGVTLYSIMLGRVLGWRSSQNLFKLGLGALLHDIGASTIDEKILCKRESDLTRDELKVLHQHCDWGATMLKQLANAPIEVLAIAAQHHEDLQGRGYPGKLDSTRVHPMAKLVGVANHFCELVLPGPASWNLSPQQAFEQMTASNAYNSDVMDALKRLLKGMP